MRVLSSLLVFGCLFAVAQSAWEITDIFTDSGTLEIKGDLTTFKECHCKNNGKCGTLYDEEKTECSKLIERYDRVPTGDYSNPATSPLLNYIDEGWLVGQVKGCINEQAISTITKREGAAGQAFTDKAEWESLCTTCLDMSAMLNNQITVEMEPMQISVGFKLASQPWIAALATEIKKCKCAAAFDAVMVNCEATRGTTLIIPVTEYSQLEAKMFAPVHYLRKCMQQGIAQLDPDCMPCLPNVVKTQPERLISVFYKMFFH